MMDGHNIMHSISVKLHKVFHAKYSLGLGPLESYFDKKIVKFLLFNFRTKTILKVFDAICGLRVGNIIEERKSWR